MGTQNHRHRHILQVLPVFRQFEESKRIQAGSGRFNAFPICYKTVDAAPHECLILEDLAVDKYIMVDPRTENLSPDHVHLVMAALGKFHATSFALKQQQPAQFRQLTHGLDEVFIRLSDVNMGKFINATATNVANIAKSLGNDEIAGKVREVYPDNVYDLVYECVRGELAEPYAVICHGDCWNNNTLFKLDADGKPTDVRLLDLQLARYASPVLDLVYYIFCCTQKELRDQFYESFLSVYHSSLAQHLERYGQNREKNARQNSFWFQLEANFTPNFSKHFSGIFSPK